jgi:hypothetical protein
MKFIVFFLNKIKRGAVRRGLPVAWPNGIVPYDFLPGYGIVSFHTKIFL